MPLRWLRVGLLGCALLPGCKLVHEPAEGDPLKGDLYKPPAAATASRESASPVPSRSNPLPELPAPATTTSTAALASGVKQTLDPNPVLASNSSDPGPTTGILLSRPQPLNNTPAAPPSPSEDSPVVLTGQVVPIPSEGAPQTSSFGAPVPPATAPPPDPGFVSAGPAPSLQSFAQVDAELRARGVIWHEDPTEVSPNLWRFACVIADPNDPTSNRRFGATAPGEGGLAAIRAVLADIDRSRQR